MDGIRDEAVVAQQVGTLKSFTSPSRKRKMAVCECVQEFEADEERFAREIVIALEESKAKYKGPGFVPMRYVKPPQSFQPKCLRHCPEAQELLAHTFRHEAG